MRIQGSFTTFTEVDVSDDEVVKALKERIRKNTYPIGLPNSSSYSDRVDLYVNKAGNWETWEDGHGSGYTTVHRMATEAERILEEKYRTWCDLTQELMKHKNNDCK